MLVEICQRSARVREFRHNYRARTREALATNLANRLRFAAFSFISMRKLRFRSHARCSLVKLLFRGGNGQSATCRKSEHERISNPWVAKRQFVVEIFLERFRDGWARSRDQGGRE